MCPNCDMKRVMREVADLMDDVPAGTKWVFLRDCRHTIPVSSWPKIHIYCTGSIKAYTHSHAQLHASIYMHVSVCFPQGHILDSVVFDDSYSGPPRCPIESCQTPILNTSRYIFKTRETAFKLTEEAKEKLKQSTLSTQGNSSAVVEKYETDQWVAVSDWCNVFGKMLVYSSA